MIHYLTYVRMVPWLNVFLKGIQIFRPHSRPLGLGIWNFKSSLGDCDAHQQLITGEMPVCSCGDKSWHSSGGTWKKNQGLRVTCLWVWWPYFPNKNPRLSCRPSRMQGHVPAVCVHEDREWMYRKKIHPTEERGVERASSSLSSRCCCHVCPHS